MKLFHLGASKEEEAEEIEIIENLDTAITQLTEVIGKLKVVQSRAEILQRTIQKDRSSSSYNEE